jgi:surface polysaccharide O-acyltransferase-like enzyme
MVLSKGCNYTDFLCHYWKYGYWYLLVLFEFFIVQAVIDAIELRFPQLRRLWIDVVMFITIFIASKRISYMGASLVGTVTDLWQFIGYLPYFYLGSLIRRYRLSEKIIRHADRLFTTALILGSLLYAFWLQGLFGESSKSAYITILLCYCLLIAILITFMSLEKHLNDNIFGRILCLIGQNSMIIYMFQFFLFKYIDFGTILTQLYASHNLIALLTIVTVTSIVIALICVIVGYLLRLSSLTRIILLGEIPTRIRSKLQ